MVYDSLNHIYQLLERNPSGLRVEDLEKETELSPSQIRRALKFYMQKQMVEKFKDKGIVFFKITETK